MILRLASTAMEGWDDWCGALALSGVDPRAWDLNMMLNALEATLQRNAEDEKKWAAEKRMLYAPPKEEGSAPQRPSPTAPGRRGRGLTAGAANALLAAVTAQDAGALSR